MKANPGPITLEPAPEPGRLQIRTKLYGRTEAVGTLWAAFEQVCRGHGSVLLVPGHSGVGKTALVPELRTPVLERNGFFVAGKFNQDEQDIPYSAFSQALSELYGELTRDDEVQRERWWTGLLQAVGNLG